MVVAMVTAAMAVAVIILVVMSMIMVVVVLDSAHLRIKDPVATLESSLSPPAGSV
jgi:hypothetical protein